MRKLIRTIRNLVALLIAAAIILGCVLGYNALTRQSRQIAVTPIPRAAVDEKNAADHLSAAIRFQTISSATDPDLNADAFRGLQAYMAETFPAFHAAAKRETVNGLSLLYTWHGSDPNAVPIALLAHQDVVPIAPGTESSWQVPPFDGTIRDGFIWGRGSWDDKGNLFSILEAVEQLAKEGFRPKHTIYLAFGADEEVGGLRGASEIAKLLAQRGVKLDYVIDEGLVIADGMLKGLDRPAALIGIAEKGYATLDLRLIATPGHSSMPPKQSAIGIMSAALAKLDRHRMPARIQGAAQEMLQTLAPEMNTMNRVVLSNLWLFKPLLLREFGKSPSTDALIRTTTALTIVNAGNQDNVLPGRVDATVNFRLQPGDTEAAVIDHVKRTIDNDAITITRRDVNTEPLPVTSTRTDAYRALNRTVREVFPDVVVAPGLMLAATDSRHYAGVTKSIFRFSPVRAKAEDLLRFHGTNERLSIANYADMIRFYRRLIENTAAP
jgi:carboxypeptidase PM20D1